MYIYICIYMCIYMYTYINIGFENAIIGDAAVCGNLSRKEIERQKMICRYQDSI
jgi:hypothetical protein